MYRDKEQRYCPRTARFGGGSWNPGLRAGVESSGKNSGKNSVKNRVNEVKGR